MELRHEHSKKDLWLILWADVFLFGSMIVIFVLDKKFNILLNFIQRFTN
jgi:hypothetical protein